jgi:hypothetical protein
VWFSLFSTLALPFAVDAVWKPLQAPRRVKLNTALAATALSAAVVAGAIVVARSDSWFEAGYPSHAEAAVAAEARSSPSLRVFANERYADWLLFSDPQLDRRVA